MSGPVRPPLTVETLDGTTVGRPITTIKVTNGDLTVSGTVATIDTSGGGGGGMTSFDVVGNAGPTQTIGNSDTFTLVGGSSGNDIKVTMSATDTATIDLQTTGVTAASYSLASITVDNKGRITAASSGSVSVPTGANPTATVSGTAVNGTAGTFMRSDAAPALADTAVTPGSYTLSSITVDQQGRITSASSGSVSVPTGANPTATVGPTATNGSASTFMRSDAAPALADTSVTPGSYTYTALTVDAQGRITAASSGTAPSDTTYDLKAAQSGDDAEIQLDASAGTDTAVKLAAGSNITLTESGGDTITIAASGGGIGGAITDNQVAYGDLTANDIEGNAKFTYNVSTQTLDIAAGAGNGTLQSGSSDLILRNSSAAAHSKITLGYDAANSNIVLDTDGSGLVEIHKEGALAYSLPNVVTGANDYVLTAQTDGTTAWAAAGGGATFPLEAPDGTAGAPSYTFSGDTNTGIYRVGSDSIGITMGGSTALTIGSANITSNMKIFGVDGGAGNPTFGFKDDTDTGIYRPATGQIGLSMNGSNKLTFGASGEILIAGTTAGSSGQVLTSGGSGSTMSWTDASGGISNSAGNLKIQKTATGSNIAQYPLFTQCTDATSSSNAVTSNNTTTASLFPFFGHKTGDIQSITCNNVGASDDDWLVRVYDVDSNNLPQNAIGSEASWDNGATGDNTLDVSGIADTWNITAGEMYYIAILLKSTTDTRPTVRTYQEVVQFNLPYCDVSTAQYNIFKTAFKLSGLSAALPSSVTTSNLTSDGPPFTQIPIIGVAY